MCITLSKYFTVYSVAILDIVHFFAFTINRHLIMMTTILLLCKYVKVKLKKKLTEKEILSNGFFDKKLILVEVKISKN